jgi:AcrR family transcriptional regulator
MELFAERGYRATTIGDIERAAGLAARRGGFYRHFESKEAVFRAGIEEAATATPVEGLFEHLDLSDEGVLSTFARFAMASTRESPLHRLIMRDGPDFPEITAFMHERLVARGCAHAAELFRQPLRRRGLATDDVEELAAVGLASLVHWHDDVMVHRGSGRHRRPRSATEHPVDPLDRRDDDVAARLAHLGELLAAGPGRAGIGHGRPEPSAGG